MKENSRNMPKKPARQPQNGGNTKIPRGQERGAFQSVRPNAAAGNSAGKPVPKLKPRQPAPQNMKNARPPRDTAKFRQENERPVFPKKIEQPAPDPVVKPIDKKTRRAMAKAMTEKEPVKREKVFRGGNYSLYFLLWTAVVILVMTILLNTVLCRCSNIEVRGNSRYSAQEIIAGAGVAEGDNVLGLDAQKAADRLVNRCYLVDEASVKKSFPTKIIITVKEAVKYFVLVNDGDRMAVSKNGRIISSEPEKEAGCEVTVRGFEPRQTVLGGWITSKVEAKNKMPWEILETSSAIGLKNITDIDLTNRFAITVTVEDRVLLNLGTINELESKLNIAKKLIDEEIGPTERVTVLLSNPEKVAVRGR